MNGTKSSLPNNLTIYIFSLITIYIFPPVYCFWIHLNLYNIGGKFPLSFKASIKLMVDVTIKDLLESRNS